MGYLIPIKYGKKDYPAPIKAKILEIPGHFDIDTLKIKNRIKNVKQNYKGFSLHTEYSYRKRKFDCSILKNKTTIKSSNYEGIPLLWRSEKWVKEFSDFIAELCMDFEPIIIEIHPPFRDYLNFSEFVEYYKIFEALITEKYPNTRILIENRNSSKYPKSDFLISNLEDLKKISYSISKESLNLRITLDIPQLFGKLGGIRKISCKKLTEIFKILKEIQDFIDGFHIWGMKGKIPHIGDLNSYFKDELKKQKFLELFSELICSSPKNFFFVPEVNSSKEDLSSIINDLLKAGIKFKQI